MINQLSLKQKIIVGVIAAAVVIGVGIYGFITINNESEEVGFDMGELIENDEINSVENDVSSEEEIEEKMIIHVAGEVNKKGIVSLPIGARIADAIDAAGGTTKEADIDIVNLAYELEDGQKVYIPSKKETEQNIEIEYITGKSGNNVVVVEERTKSEGVNGKVNINKAAQSDLENLPGIGPSIASRIIEYREQNGKFAKIEDLQNVKGIGDAKFSNIKEYVTVE